MNWADLIGYSAGTISAITFLPQVIKTWKMKAAGEISFLMIFFVSLGVSLWIIYGISIKNNVLIITNSFVLILSLFLHYFKWKYKD